MRKTIVITGAAGGIGKHVAFVLSSRGHNVIASTETSEQADKLKSEVTEAGLSIEVIKLDITDKYDQRKIESYNIDVFINNAGIGESGSLAEIEMDRVRRNFEVNVFSTFEISQLALAQMMQKKKGTVIFVSSLAGRITMPFLAPYCMTKFALSAGAETLRHEVHKAFKNIHISIIEPGAYGTGFNQKNIAKKYEWMDEKSPFYKMLHQIKKTEEWQFGMTEGKSTKSIVNKIVKAVEANKPKLRYSAPFWQAFGVRLLRIMGK